MPLITPCAHEGCDVLTMGVYCIEHEHLADGSVTAALIDAAAAAADAARDDS